MATRAAINAPQVEKQSQRDKARGRAEDEPSDPTPAGI